MEDLQDLSLGETRQILWNAPEIFREHFVELFNFMALGLPFGLFLLWGVTVVYPLYRWYSLVSEGQPEHRFDQIGVRFTRMMFEGIGQGRVVRENPSGVVHQVLFVSFLVLFLGTTLITVEADTIINFYFGAFYAVYKFMMDLAGVTLMVSSGYFLYRRYAAPPRALSQPPRMLDNFSNESGYGFALVMLFLIGLTGFMLEAARIVADPRSAVGFAFVGGSLAVVFRTIGTGGSFHYWVWVVHLLIVLVFLYSLTSTNLRHMFIAPVNIFFKRLGPGYRATPVTDFENAETFGVEKIEEHTWKQLLDMAACLECGRCTLLCPTVNTDKTLNPKFLVIQQREHLVARHGLSFLSAQLAKFAKNGLADESSHGESGGSTPLLAAEEGQDQDWLGQADMINEVATADAIWGCTNCGWCEEGCPVAIEHIQRIVDMRRHSVLVRADFPPELAKSFKGTENQGNPWGIGADQRAEWAADLEVPLMAEIGEEEKVEVLYWVGCAGSFDDRNQKTSKALVKIFRAAGVRFGILGPEEQCTGEPARRLGNEYLYFTLAQMNVETLRRYKFEKIVTQCPHCFNTMRNEYPDLGGDFEIVHTAQFIEGLLEDGRIKLGPGFLREKLVMHDPCFLARHNNVHEEPRTVLDAVPGMERDEIDQSRRRTFCCGAGGGQFWKEEEHGTPRINAKRLEQLMVKEPDTIGVGCPFCATMMTDATKDAGIEEQVEVRDLVEIVADSLC